MNIEQKSKIAFNYLIESGFPYYQYSADEKQQIINKLFEYDYKSLLKDDVLRQTMHGLGLAWSYFPHSWEIQTRNMKTPIDIWNDKNLLLKAVLKRLKRGGESMLLPNGKMTDSQARKALRSYSGVQSVSNFRPSAAACIYANYANNGIVWDMSSGFGGRLLGAIISKNVKKYIGTDPSSKTFNGLLQIKKDFEYLPINIELHNCGSEIFVPNEKVDLCFTSPPYFNTEKYADENTQSYIKFNNVDSWNQNFLAKTIQNCYASLKENGFLLINVANTITHKNLENDCINIATNNGFILEKIIKMQLSNITKGGFKYEPIFVFQKENL